MGGWVGWVEENEAGGLGWEWVGGWVDEADVGWEGVNGWVGRTASDGRKGLASTYAKAHNAWRWVGG